MNSTPYDSWCTTFDFLVVFNGRRFIVRARGTKISYDRWSDIAHVVSELPTARKSWYISFLPTSFKRDIPCIQWERATLPILNHILQTFSLFFALFCRRVLARKKWCGTYQCCYKFWLWLFLFCNLFFQNFFSKFFFDIFFSKFVFQFFFQNFCFKFFFF